MQLESHATPTGETPQQRRAILQRALDRGLESDEIWRELAEIALGLGHDDEAVRCLRRIGNPTLRSALESRIERRGRLTAGERPPAHQHGAAPAASDAGHRPAAAVAPHETRDDAPGLRDHAADAVQFLFQQHMPWLCVLLTLAFPVIVGLGGFLTAGGSPFGLAAIAAVPGLCVLLVVAAMSRRILTSSQAGIADAPEVPALGALLADAVRCVFDAVLVIGCLLLPSTVALLLGSPLVAVAPGLLLGMFCAPLAFGLRQVRSDLGALSPAVLLRGVVRGGAGHAGLVVFAWGTLLPAALVALALHDREPWLQIAAIGPFVVVPMFVVCRLLGTWLDAQRRCLGSVLGPQAARAAAPAVAPPFVPAPMQARSPEALRHLAAPDAHRADSARAAWTAAAAAARAAAGPAKAAAKSPASPPPAAAPEPLAIEGRQPRRPAVTDAPDLSRMPGAVLVSGEERVRHGAAARVK